MKANDLMEYAILNGEVNKAALIEMIRQLPEEIRQRFVEAILCISYPKEITVPDVKTIYGHNNCRFKGYNYLFDRVEYEYDEEETRWFADDVSAKRYAENGFGSWNGLREPQEGHEFEASYVFTYKSECPLKSWMEAK